MGTGSPPTTLAAKKPVAELVIYGSLTNLVGFEPFDDLRDALFLVEAVQAKRVVLAVDVGAVAQPSRLQEQSFGRSPYFVRVGLYCKATHAHLRHTRVALATEPRSQET